MSRYEKKSDLFPKKIILGLIFFALAGFAASCSRTVPSPIQQANQTNNSYSHAITIGVQTLHVEIADTPSAQQLGLSGRAAMAQDEGMLFDFHGSRQTRPGFWMKDMKFPLDFIWVNRGFVVDLTKNVPPPHSTTDPLPVFHPSSPVDTVIEVNAGWINEHNIRVGDIVRRKN